MSERPRDPLLTASAVLGVLVVVVVAVLGATHSRPVAFRSGSMAPAIDTGSVALVHEVPAADLEVGDVVTVPTQGTFVTHRIVQLTRSGTAATLQLQGDANATPDAELYDLASAERVVFSVPWLGYLLGALTGPAGLFLGATYVVWLLRRVLAGSPRRRARPTHRAPQPARRHRRRIAVGAVAVVVVGATTVAASPRVWAAGWTDAVGVSGTTLTAVTTPPGTSLSCGGLQLGSTTVTWQPVAAASGYRVWFGANASQSEDVGPGVSSRQFSGSAGTVAVEVLYGTAKWVSAPSNRKRYTSTLGLLGTCADA